MTPPAGLIRFYGNTCFGLDVLNNRHIALVRVTLLNDPFDPYGFFETDFGNYVDLLKYVRTHHRGDMGWFRNRVKPQSWAETERTLKDFMTRLRTETFVLCASASTEAMHPKDNLYMWGHYGNGHRGLAIEFDHGALGEAVLNHHYSHGTGPLIGEQPWVQIEYEQSFRAISAEDAFQFFREMNEIETRRKREPDETSLERYYGRLSKIKSDVWRAENEWRIMWRSQTETASVYKIPITPECIRAIYLGLAMSDDEKRKVIDAVTHFPDARVWLASKRHGDFSLDFHCEPDRRRHRLTTAQC
jgi:hypothetical protein